jgi:spore coat protein A
VNELPERHLLPVDHTLHGAGPELPEVRAVVHVHGARAPAASDGYPEDWLVPGRSAVAHYPGEQDAATLWYHDHAMGLERLNQYAGLLGCFLVRDDVEESLGLPDRPHEIPLVLCDRRFDADGQLRYPTSGKPGAPWVPEVYADTTLVNGKLYPYAEVEAAAYRLRVVNASNSRTYRLSLGVPGEAGAAPALHQIGSDQGLLSSPVAISTLTLAPAERADLVVDLRGREGQRVLMRDQASELLELRVGSSPPRPPRPVPAKLRPVPKMAESEAARTRILTLDEYRDRAAGRMLMLLDGKYWHDPVSEKPELGSVEIWTLLNLTDDAHPIHVHLVRLQVLDRRPFDDDGYRATRQLRWTGEPQPPPLTESGWKDTAVALPGMATRLIMRFGGYPGRYVWHCHVLEHAANAMMRPFEVVAPA